MDITDRKLLNIIQGPFPLVEQPYLEIGRELEISEDEVLQRLAKLKQQTCFGRSVPSSTPAG